MIKIAVAHQKGGVGKSTIAFNLAHILAQKRNTGVLAVDNDPQGNLTQSFLENPVKDLKANILNVYDEQPLIPQLIDNNLYLIGSDITLSPVAERDFQVIFKLKEALEEFENEPEIPSFDYIIIDSLPSFGHLHLAALTAADYVLIPIKPDPYALQGMKDLFSTIEKTKKYFNQQLEILGIIVNQKDGRRPNLERDMEEALREVYGDLVFKSTINKRIKIVESPAYQQPITEYAPNDMAAEEFNAMTKELMQRISRLRKKGEK